MAAMACSRYCSGQTNLGSNAGCPGQYLPKQVCLFLTYACAFCQACGWNWPWFSDNCCSKQGWNSIWLYCFWDPWLQYASCSYQSPSLPTKLASLLRTHAHDERVYKTLTRAGLAFKDVITHVQIPTLDDAGEVEFRNFPMILPHSMAAWLQPMIK